MLAPGTTVLCNHRVSWIRVYSYGPHNRRLTRANVRDAPIPRSASQHGGAARMQIRFPLFVPIELLTSALCLTFLYPYLLRVSIAFSLKWDMFKLSSESYTTVMLIMLIRAKPLIIQNFSCKSAVNAITLIRVTRHFG